MSSAGRKQELPWKNVHTYLTYPHICSPIRQESQRRRELLRFCHLSVTASRATTTLVRTCILCASEMGAPSTLLRSSSKVNLFGKSYDRYTTPFLELARSHKADAHTAFHPRLAAPPSLGLGTAGTAASHELSCSRLQASRHPRPTNMRGRHRRAPIRQKARDAEN